MTKALKITPAGDIIDIEVSELEDYQREVVGSIEALPLGDAHALVINEEGKSVDPRYNLIASLLVAQHKTGLALDDYIAGTALVVGARPGAEDWCDVDEAFAQQTRTLAGKA